ncbi:MAG: archease [Proteobacteria bacterium]|nr:archease [Pseudomonadota bacterium]MBU4472121.1 archease [Pseudomonadota bacterium]MCG2752880.1 archease [Desulfobacteraceae bacterium]
MTPYTLLDHTADLGISVSGNSMKDLFKNAGLALFDLMVLQKCRNKGIKRQLRVIGLDPPDLLVNWLRELLNLWTLEGRIATTLEIQTLDECSLSATVETVVFDSRQDEINHDIKAVTYHGVDVQPVAGQWKATVIFDV